MSGIADLAADTTDYPTTDGKPMAETDLHRRLMIAATEILLAHFAAPPDVYVSGNLLVYYEKGNARKHLSPDCFVVRGVRPGDRDVFKVWDEGKFPDFVLEITSRTTRADDVDDKFRIYRDVWKVPEYFLFDPREEYLSPSLQGYRLVDGTYQPIPLVRGQLHSDSLGLRLERSGVRLIFRDPTTGRELLRPQDEQLRREREQRELADAKLAALEEEVGNMVEHQRETVAELARLRAELDALRNPPKA